MSASCKQLPVWLASLCLLASLFAATCSEPRARTMLTPEEKAWLNDHRGKIAIAVLETFGPYQSRNDQGIHVGFAVDYLRKIEEQLGFTFIRIPVKDRNEAVAALKNDRVQFAFGLGETPETRKHFLFSKPVTTTSAAVILPRSERSPLELSDLKGRTVATVTDSGISNFLIGTYGSMMDIRPMPSALEALAATSFGRTDACVLNLTVASHMLAIHNFTNLQLGGVVGPTIKMRFSVRRDLPKFLIILTKAIDHIPADTLNDLETQWLGLDNENLLFKTTFLGWMAGALVFGVVAVLGLISINNHLKAAVAQRAEALNAEIEERRRVESELAQLRRMEALGTLARGMAHDFNSYLGIIIGSGEMLARRDIAAEGQGRERIDRLLDASYLAQDLVRQVLTFSHGMNPARTCVSLTAVAQETVRLLQADLPGNITVTCAKAPANDYVLANPSQIHQVLMNLGNNAVRSLKESGTEGCVRFSVNIFTSDPGTKKVELTVEDTGPGMAPEVQSRMFEPFYSTRPQGEGHGMGLAVVYGIVASLDGTIDVKSRPGKGTHIRIVLPHCTQDDGQSGED